MIQVTVSPSDTRHQSQLFTKRRTL